MDANCHEGYLAIMKSPGLPKYPAFLVKTMAHPVLWVAVSLMVLMLDWFGGAAISFPFMFIFPVTLAAWHRGFKWGAVFAVGLPLIRYAFSFVRESPWSDFVSVINLGIRVAVLLGGAWMIAHTVKQQRRIETLERLLPICAWCGKIHVDGNAWERLDSYLALRTDLKFTHTICRECAGEQFAKRAAKIS